MTLAQIKRITNHNMQKISVVIITYNEEKYIERCIKSVEEVADEIIVVDSFSTDRTKEICLRLGVQFIEHPFTGFRDQKNYAIEQANYDYVLSLDADEALSPKLIRSIIAEKANLKYDGYKFNRLNNFCGRWLKYTSMYPERKIRLFNKNKGEWSGLNIHETIILKNPKNVKTLKGDLLHWLYDSYEESIAKINSYTSLSAKEYFYLGIKSNGVKLIISPLWRFLYSYVIRGGFLLGYDGYIVSRIQALSCFLKYYKLRRLYLIHKKPFNGNNSSNANPNIFNTNFTNSFSENINIGFDAKRAYFNASGLGNYSRNLLNALYKNYPKNNYILFTPKSNHRYKLENDSEFKIIQPHYSFFKMFGSFWRSKFITKDIKKNNIQIFHGLSQELPLGIKKSGAKSVLTVHDLIFLRFPEFYNKFDAKIYYYKLVYSCKVADHIVAISKQTKDDLIQLLNISPNKISVVYQGCNKLFWNKCSYDFNNEVKLKHNLPDKYLLYVGTIEERKNLLGIIKGMHIYGIETPLVVVGRKNSVYFKTIQEYITSNNIKNIIFTNNVSNAELPAFYQKAECFIYPSFFEGFGIPILEALASGTPVITSKFGCLNEAAGPNSLYVNPYYPEEIGKAILRLTTDKELRDRIIANGYEYANNFKDEAIANSYMKIYISLLQ